MKTRWILLSTFYNQNHAIKKEDIQLFVITELSEYKNNKTNIPFFLSLSQIQITPCVNANVFIMHQMRTDILMQLILVKPFDKTNNKPSEFDIGIGIKQDVANLFSVYVVLAFPKHPSLSIGIARNILLEFDIGLAVQLNKNKKTNEQNQNINDNKTQTKKDPAQTSTNKGVEDQAMIYHEYDNPEIPSPLPVMKNAKPRTQNAQPSYMRPTQSSQAKQNTTNPNNTWSKTRRNNNNYLTPTISSINRQRSNSVAGMQTAPYTLKQNSTPSSLSRSTPNEKQIKTQLISANTTRTPNKTVIQSNPSPRNITNSPRRPIKTNASNTPTISHIRRNSFQSTASNQSQHSIPNTNPGLPVFIHSRANSIQSTRSTSLTSRRPLKTSAPNTPTIYHSRRSSFQSTPSNQSQHSMPSASLGSFALNHNRTNSIPPLTPPRSSRQSTSQTNSKNSSLSSITVSSLSNPTNTDETHMPYITNTKQLKKTKKRKINASNIQNDQTVIDLVDESLKKIKIKTLSNNDHDTYTCDQTSTRPKKYTLQELKIFKLTELKLIRQWLTHTNTCPIPIKISTQKRENWTYILATEIQEELKNENLRSSNIEKWRTILDYLITNRNFHKEENKKKTP